MFRYQYGPMQLAAIGFLNPDFYGQIHRTPGSTMETEVHGLCGWMQMVVSPPWMPRRSATRHRIRCRRRELKGYHSRRYYGYLWDFSRIFCLRIPLVKRVECTAASRHATVCRVLRGRYGSLCSVAVPALFCSPKVEPGGAASRGCVHAAVDAELAGIMPRFRYPPAETR